MLEARMPNIECPPSMARHVREIFNGEYDLPYSHPAPTIVDIGANVGGFAIWASHRWQSSMVYCYEPVPSTFEILQRNVSRFDRRRFKVNNFAIGNIARTRMFLGENNCGEASFFNIGEQTTNTVDVETKHANVLPPAQILKLDAEGSEVEILESHPAIEYEAILVEFHGDNQRRQIDGILRDYCLIGAHVRHLHRGILKYVHRSIVPAQFTRYELR